MMNNTYVNPMNYIYPKINFNKLCFPQILPFMFKFINNLQVNLFIALVFLSKINNKESTQSSNHEKKTKNNINVCPIIGKGNNEIKTNNNKNFVLN